MAKKNKKEKQNGLLKEISDQINDFIKFEVLWMGITYIPRMITRLITSIWRSH